MSKRVCVIGPVGDRGGPSYYFNELVIILNKLGYEVSVVTRRSVPLSISKLIKKIYKENFKIRSIQLKVLNILLDKFDIFIKNHQVYPSLIDFTLRLLGKPLNFRYIYVNLGSRWFDFIRPKLLNGSIFHKLLVKCIDLSWKFILSNAYRIIADIDVAKRLCTDYNIPREKIVRVLTTVDVENFNPRVNPLRLVNNNKKIVMFVGRLDAEKGVDVLIKAMSLVLSHRRDVQLIVVGEGKLREILEDLATSLKISEHITFVGKVPYTEVPKYMASADIIIYPVVWGAGYGSVTVEAMALGKPLIVGGANTMLRRLGGEGCVCVINPLQVSEIAERIVYLLSNPKERKKLSRRALKYVLNNCTIQNQEEIWKKVLKLE